MTRFASSNRLGLVAFAGFFYFCSLPARAELTINSSFADINSSACISGGSCDAKDGDLATIIGPVNSSLSSSATGMGYDSASGMVQIVSLASLTNGVLDFSGNLDGSATANSTANTTGLGEVTAQMNIEISETYGFTVSGSITITDATGISSDENSCTVEISGSKAEGFFDTLQGVGNKTLSGSGTLPAGSYTVRVFLNSLAEAGGTRPPSDKSTVAMDFAIKLTPGTAPTPTPTPTPVPINWDNPAGGSFQVATNWDPQLVPGTGNIAIFALDAAYAVDVGTAATSRLEVRNGNVAFLGNTYTVNALAFDPASIVVNQATFGLTTGLALFGVHALIGESAAARLDVLSGAILSLTGSLRVGGAGEGTLMVEAGGLVFSGEGRVGTGPGGGDAVLSGTGAGWSSGNLAVGFGGTGSLTVEGGALLTSGVGTIGLEAGSTGSILVLGDPASSGDQSRWNCTGLTIGEGGSGSVEVDDLGEILLSGAALVNGTLLVTDGAAVDHSSHTLGIGNTADGEVTVSGFDPSGPFPARLIGITDLTIGQQASGVLAIQNGGQVTSANGIMGSAASGEAVVNGFGDAASTWQITSQLTVGQSNFASLEVADGGSVSAHDVTAGAGVGSSGLITVKGRSSSGPSFLSAEQNLILGLEGSGLMTIEEDAVVTCVDSSLGALSGAIGRAELGVDGAAGDPARWVVNGNLSLGGSGVGDVVLRNSANVTIGQTLFILANGSIGGNGTFSAQSVENSGTGTPGLSPGTLVLDADYIQTAAGKLAIEAAGLDAGEFDILHVTGDAVLDGTLEMKFLDYLPKAGDSFQFLEVEGTISGAFAEVAFPQLLAGFQFDMTQTAGGLVFTAINDAVLAPTFLLNISTRALVGTDDDVMIGGFIITGDADKRVIIRAIGPSLEAFGIDGALVDTTLELHDSTGALIGENEDWQTTQIGGVITADQFAEIQTSGLAPTDSGESAIIATLAPGAYTAILAGANDNTGVGLVEVYDLGPASIPGKLANISTRGQVQSGDNVMIGGFIVGNQSSEVLVRGIGPSLGAFGVSDALANPTLELRDGSGALLASNDDWRNDQETEIEASGLAPSDDAESAILRTLAPGAYTAILRGVAETTGVGLVEAYNLD